MRCIECGTDCRRRDRKDGRCPRCRHPFAFEPSRESFWLTDMQFKKAIDHLSAGGTGRFTERNLWYEVHRRWASSGVWRHAYSVGTPAFLGALPGLVLAKLFDVPALYWLCAVGAVVAVGTSAYHTWRHNRRPAYPQSPPSLPLEAFRSRFLPRWMEVNGPIPGLLPSREDAAAAMPREVPADVAAFSFDRAVVTDRWETAQVLVANRFHFEHNCAVLSLDGYPDGIADTVKEMLRRNPRLTVFALHDASAEGCRLPLALRDPAWFPDPATRIVDLGLSPETAKRLRLPELTGPTMYRNPPLMKMLSSEKRWLAEGHSAELAALRPPQMMRAVYRGILAAGPYDATTASRPDAGGGAGVYGGGMIWISDVPGGVDTAKVDGFG
jgi:hypothetical protein